METTFTDLILSVRTGLDKNDHSRAAVGFSNRQGHAYKATFDPSQAEPKIMFEREIIIGYPSDSVFAAIGKRKVTLREIEPTLVSLWRTSEVGNAFLLNNTTGNED